MRKSTIIIPVFNHAALTAQCLKAVCTERGAEVIVVDDASTDHTQQVLRSFGRKLKVIRHKENRGFAVSCNEGAKAATGEFLVFLNNDTVALPGWLQALERYAAENEEAAAVGAKLVYPNDTIQHAGVVICQDRYPRHIYTGFPMDHPGVNKSRRFQLVTAACMLARRQPYEEMGGFDTAFRNGFEDVDLCLRLGARGHEVHYCATSVVRHLESVSVGRFKHDRENVRLYRERWLSHVRPDDLQYYIEDGLLQVHYEGQYPIGLEVSPQLATFDGEARIAAIERLLQERSRQVTELMRENNRLSLELGTHPTGSSALEYRRLRQQIQQAVQRVAPPGAKIAVISKGDGALLDFPERQGWHFPQTDRGAYAGYHPADSKEAIAHLEAVRAKGAQFLVIPASSQWWLSHYQQFQEYLDRNYARLMGDDAVCSIHALSGAPGEYWRGHKPTSGRVRQADSPALRSVD